MVNPIEAIPKLTLYVFGSFFFFDIGGFMFLEETNGS